MLLVIAVSTLLFTLTHVWVWRRVEPDLTCAFKLSRGLAALVLTGLGFAGLVAGRVHWQQGYLYRHEPGDWMEIAVAIVYGHFLSDLIWMAFTRLKFGAPQRVDLLLHHLIGMVAFGIALHLRAGYAIALLAMASELLPCCTALDALGKHRGSTRLEHFAKRARLGVLVFWRIPLWGFMLAMLVRTVATGQVEPGLEFGSRVAMACLALLLALDVYWIRKCGSPAQTPVEDAFLKDS